jgi:hypothetical protein
MRLGTTADVRCMVCRGIGQSAASSGLRPAGSGAPRGLPWGRPGASVPCTSRPRLAWRRALARGCEQPWGAHVFTVWGRLATAPPPACPRRPTPEGAPSLWADAPVRCTCGPATVMAARASDAHGAFPRVAVRARRPSASTGVRRQPPRQPDNSCLGPDALLWLTSPLLHAILRFCRGKTRCIVA